MQQCHYASLVTAIDELLGIFKGIKTLRSINLEGTDREARAAKTADVLEQIANGDPKAPHVVDHLESTHHAYLHAEFDRLDALAEKVVGAHGTRHPELGDIQATYKALRADLEPHLTKEERVLFPMIRQLASTDDTPNLHCGSIVNPIAMMMLEHDRAGELLATLRTLTNGYSTPDDACASYRALFEGLEQLEADTHLHVHKENNLLFPAVAALEVRMTASHG